MKKARHRMANTYGKERFMVMWNRMEMTRDLEKKSSKNGEMAIRGHEPLSQQELKIS